MSEKQSEEVERDPFTLDPNIWKNPTLGAVGAGPFLPELEVQQQEDANARREGREPKVVEYVHRHPKFIESSSIPSQQEEFNFVEPDVAYGRVSSESPVAEEDNNPTTPPIGENTTQLPKFDE